MARQLTQQPETARRTAAQKYLSAEKERDHLEQDHLERARLVAIIDSSDDGITSIDLDGLITSWNKSAERASGVPATEAIGQHVSFLAPPGQTFPIAEDNERMRRGEVIAPTEIETQNRHGSSICLMLTVSPIWDGAGNLVGSSAITRDITARKRAQEEARQSEARLAQAQRIARIGSWELEVATGRLTWSQEMFRLIEFDPAQGEPSEGAFLSRFHPDDLPARTQAFAAALATGQLYQMDVRIVLPSGGRLWCRSAGQPVLDAQGQALRVVGTMMDITERKETEQRLHEYAVLLEFQKNELELQKHEMEKANAALAALATTDGLTGLYNHRTFQKRLAEEVSRTARYGTPLSLIMLDVDRFKQYNDAYGHPAGDKVLRNIAQLLRQASRETDLVARYGGEEFALILPQTDGGEAVVVAERIRRLIEEARWPFRTVTASLGVATRSAIPEDGSDLLAVADAALYRSKAGGRNRITHGIIPMMIPRQGADSGMNHREEGW